MDSKHVIHQLADIDAINILDGQSLYIIACDLEDYVNRIDFEHGRNTVNDYTSISYGPLPAQLVVQHL